MPLTLITGPANAAKAGAVLERLREALDRAGSARLPAPEPLLVVPTSADVESYQRELAAVGVVFGGEVTTFDGLLGLVAARAGYRGRVLGRVARGRVVTVVVAEAELRVLAASAATPGFAHAAERLFAELQHALVSPERFTAALRRWAAETAGDRRAYAEEVAGLYAAYRRRLRALGRIDADGHAWEALDALRRDPSRWGGRPVFLYGFDDLTPAQLDAVETLVRACGAPVTLSLTYEAGRAAFADRAATVQTLSPLADELVELPERADHYAPAARPALHWLERRLFEAPPEAERVSPNGAVRLLEAGGERAEAELVGAALLELVEQGAEPAELAVLLGSPEQAPLLAQVLEAYGLPVERAHRSTLARTRLGAGLLAFGRAALAEGTAADVLTWLRTPGKPAAAERVDALERAVRRTGAATARDAERLWGRPLVELDALRGAAGATAPLDVLLAELEAIWTARHHRRADVLDADSHADARVAAQARKAVAELRSLAAAEPRLVGGLADVLAALGDVEVSLGAGTGAGVLLADPLAVRARRFRAVVVCGLQDGAFPAIARSEPFLDDADRRSLARATGVVLPLHEDSLPAERYRFYAAVSRAREVLFVAFRSSDEEGEPQLRSPFVDDVRDCFTDELWTTRGRRLLAEVTWPPAQAPTPLELRRAQAAALGRAGRGGVPLPAGAGSSPRRWSSVAARQVVRETTAAGDLETYSACGVRWLVERVLRPARIDPDPEPLARGSLAHHVLERTLTLLRERTGSARLAPERLAAARAALRDAIAEAAATRAGAEARAGLLALAADLGRWLALESAQGPGYEPRELEWSFGGKDDEQGPLELGALRVSGRVDRIDVGPAGEALVRDYKASRGYPRAKWAVEGRMQAALYAVAARELLGLDPAGALYQPLRGADLRPRGAARAGAAAAGLVATDVVDAAEWDAVLADMTEQARDAAARLRAGEIVPCPERCTTRGCAYPAICRAPGSEPPPEADA